MGARVLVSARWWGGSYRAREPYAFPAGEPLRFTATEARDRLEDALAHPSWTLLDLHAQFERSFLEPLLDRVFARLGVYTDLATFGRVGVELGYDPARPGADRTVGFVLRHGLVVRRMTQAELDELDEPAG